jgi:hypothetical protein
MSNIHQLQSYVNAQDWIKGGRGKGIDRTLYYRGMRLQARKGGLYAVHIPWLHADIATIDTDDVLTIQAPIIQNGYWGPWHSLKSQGIRYSLMQIAGVQNVFQRQGKHYITEKDPQYTPSKMQRCRSCKGSGLIDKYCSPNMCYNKGSYGVCEEHPNAAYQNQYSRWHYLPCEHGIDTGHTITRGQQCYYCVGSGQRDYGNKPISLMWDGSPLRIKDGKVIKKALSELEKAMAAYVQPIG